MSMICSCNWAAMPMAGWFWGLSVTKCYNSGENRGKRWEDITQIGFLAADYFLPQTYADRHRPITLTPRDTGRSFRTCLACVVGIRVVSVDCC